MLSNSVLVLNKTEIWENPSLASIQIPLPACSLFSTERLLFSVTVKIKKNKKSSQEHHIWVESAAAAAKSLQSCPTLCDPIDGSPPGSTVPGILQARTMEWVAISFSNAGKWEVKVKSWSHSVVSDSLQPHGLQPTRLLCPWDFLGKSTGVGCHCLLQ